MSSSWICRATTPTMKIAILYERSNDERSIMEIEFEPTEDERLLLELYNKKGLYRDSHFREGSSDYVVAMYFHSYYGKSWRALPEIPDFFDDIDIDEECECKACLSLRKYIGFNRKDFDYVITTDCVENDPEDFCTDKMNELVEFIHSRSSSWRITDPEVRMKAEKLDASKLVSTKRKKLN